LIDLSKLSDEQYSALVDRIRPKMTKYIPYDPTPKQMAFLAMNHIRELLYGGAAGGGKDTTLCTAIRTPTGWTTMGEVQVGDYVIGDDGKPTKVVWKSDVMHNRCFKLTFNKEQEVVVGEGHEWVIHRRRQDRKERVVELQTTKQLFERFSRNAPKNRGSLYALPVCRVDGLPRDLKIDPYVLGVWLADGCVRSGNISTVEEDVREEFRKLGYDVYFTKSSVHYDRPDIHGDAGRLHHWCSKKLRNELREYGFLGSIGKCIPDDVMYGSYEQRLALLQGMLDADGCAVDRPTGDVELTLANKELAHQFEELIRSLGIKVTCRHSVDKRNDPRYPRGVYHRYRMHWTSGIPMFRMERKLKRQAKETPATQKWHYLSNIEECETVPTQCIQVDNGSHQYLITNMLIPTHNSIGQMMAALQYVDVPGYSAILFRKTYADLSLPGALISISKEWLMPWVEQGEVRWSDKDKKYTFPGGATLAFGYLESDNDCYRYQGAEFQYIGMDECTHISPSNYRYLHSRLRKPKSLDVPLRFRATANPGGTYGEYYYDRFFVDKKDRIFIGAGLKDNPHLDAEEYERSLDELDDVTREQLLNGNWQVKDTGDLFSAAWFIPTDKAFTGSRRSVRFWDMASTDPSKGIRKKRNKDPDYTVGLKLVEQYGMYCIEDIIRVRKTPNDVEKIVKNTAIKDGYSTAIRQEQEPGSSGQATIDHYARNVLQGFNYAGVRSTGSKVERAALPSAAAQSGSILLLDTCRNKSEFLAEAEMFPFEVHDDMIDALSGAIAYFKNPVVVRAPTSALSRGNSYWKRY
jgi:predicted phage terminase large subunit-like protein